MATALPTTGSEHRNVSLYLAASEKMRAGESALNSGTCNYSSASDSADNIHKCGHSKHKLCPCITSKGQWLICC